MPVFSHRNIASRDECRERNSWQAGIGKILVSCLNLGSDMYGGGGVLSLNLNLLTQCLH